MVPVGQADPSIVIGLKAVLDGPVDPALPEHRAAPADPTITMVPITTMDREVPVGRVALDAGGRRRSR